MSQKTPPSHQSERIVRTNVMMTRRVLAMVLGGCVGIGALSTNANAQTRPSAGDRPIARPGGGAARPGAVLERIDVLLEGVSVTPEQRKTLNDIVAQSRKDMKELRPTLQGLTNDERIAKLRDVLAGVRKNIDDVLTEDQRKELDAKIAEMPVQAGPPPQRPAAAKPDGAKMLGDGAPSTQPSDKGPTAAQAGDGRARQYLKRLQDGIAKLNLTPEQKPQIEALATKLKGEIEAIRQTASTDPQAAVEKLRTMMSGMREELSKVLTPEQLVTLGGAMQASERAGAGALERPKARAGGAAGDPKTKPADATAPKTEEPKMEGMDGKPAAKPAIVPKTEPAEAPRVMLIIGADAPDFSLTRLDGKKAEMSTYAKQTLVILFGNYSTPAFRQQIPAVEEIRRKYNGRVQFLMVYTRERHPVGGWEVERNKTDEIAVEQPADMTARTRVATQAKDALKITMPIAVDSIDDAVAKAYGVSTSAALIVKDGKITAKQTWVEPIALQRMIDETLAAKPAAESKE